MDDASKQFIDLRLQKAVARDYSDDPLGFIEQALADASRRAAATPYHDAYLEYLKGCYVSPAPNGLLHYDSVQWTTAQSSADPTLHLTDNPTPAQPPIYPSERGRFHYDPPTDQLLYRTRLYDPVPIANPVEDDPLAPRRPVAYARSAARAARSAVFTYHAPDRVCLRCGRTLFASAVVVARPGLPAETIHLTCLEAEDQVQPRPTEDPTE